MILDPAINVARKSALAYVGAIALTSDLVGETVEQLAKRGAEFEHSARARLDQATGAMRERFMQATRSLRKQTDAAAIVVEEQKQPAAGENLLAQGRDRLLDLLSIPTQNTLHDLDAQLDRVRVALDDLRTQNRRMRVAEASAAPAVEATPEPLPGYDKMNVDTVVRQLPRLDEAGVRAIRTYEQAHGKRVTVLRAIEERLVLKAEA